MTHAELVERAVWWLSESRDCGIVLSEQGGGLTSEMADAIGWHDGKSILVECKASIADLRADFKKPWRMYPDLGIGQFRWYMVSKDLEDAAKKVLDERARGVDEDGSRKGSEFQYLYGWGLLVCHPSQIRIAMKPEGWSGEWSACEGRISELGKEYERSMLIAALSRIAFRIGKVTLSKFLRLPSPEAIALLAGEVGEPQ